MTLSFYDKRFKWVVLFDLNVINIYQNLDVNRESVQQKYKQNLSDQLYMKVRL